MYHSFYTFPPKCFYSISNLLVVMVLERIVRPILVGIAALVLACGPQEEEIASKGCESDRYWQQIADSYGCAPCGDGMDAVPRGDTFKGLAVYECVNGGLGGSDAGSGDGGSGDGYVRGQCTIGESYCEGNDQILCYQDESGRKPQLFKIYCDDLMKTKPGEAYCEGGECKAEPCDPSEPSYCIQYKSGGLYAVQCIDGERFSYPIDSCK